MPSMTPVVLRNALIELYGDGYITKFSTKIGRRRQTVHRWLRGEYPIPLWAVKMVILLIKEKKHGPGRTSRHTQETV